MKLNPSAHDIRQSALASLIHEISGISEEEMAGAGWFTAATIAQEKGCTTDAANKRLRRKLEGGSVEIRLERINGRPTAFFRVKA
jgi:hypothetical protein